MSISAHTTSKNEPRSSEGSDSEAKLGRLYVVGGVASVVLTVLAFAVALTDLSRSVALWSLAVLAVAQIVVQLRCFLHITFKKQQREDLLLILFSLLLLGLMAGGTIWVMSDLSARM